MDVRARVTRWAQSPPVMRAVFAVARRWKPVFALGGRTIVCRHADVVDVLARDREFSVVTAYAAKMQRTSGDFFLGMDDGPQYRREVGIMRQASRPEDLERIREFVAGEAAAAVARGRRRGWMDAVGELTRRVPIRLVDHYFGVPAPDEATMAHWMRILFDVLFFDLDGDKLAEGEAAAAELNRWVERVIVDRRRELAAGTCTRDDLLTRLIRMQSDPATHLDDLGIRRNINGLIIGSVDSTSKAAANALAQLMIRPGALAGARSAIERGDGDQLRGWILDALRFDPLGLAVPRHAAVEATIGTGRGRRTVAAGAPLWVFTFSAMFDGEVVEAPGELRPDRPADAYVHFGSGLHTCFGRAINYITLPGLLAPLLAEPGIYADEPMRHVGPFPDRLVVGFESDRAVSVAPYQAAFAMVAPLRDDAAADAVRALLDEAGHDVRFNTILPLATLTTVHYLRMLVVEGEPDGHGNPVPASLALATDFDPPQAEHLDELVAVGGDGLCRILEHCAGFPAAEGRTPAAVRAFLEEHACPAQARYVGTTYRTAARIKGEAALRKEIAAFLDAEQERGTFIGRSPAAVRRAVRQHLRPDPSFAWVWEQPPAVPDTAPGLATRILGLVAFALASLWWLLPLYLVLRLQEARDARRDDPDGRLARAEARRRRERMVAREDFLVQNQLTHLVAIKPGWLRLLALNIVFRVIDLLARWYYVRGHLGGIPSIHFARWMIIDGGRRLIFFSNYDGSWESYLGDFVDRASSPLSAIWSNTVGFPRTRFLVAEGSRDEDRFKTWARSRQIRTQLWYCAYPELSVQNVNDNSAIRAGLLGELDDDELAAWVARL